MNRTHELKCWPEHFAAVRRREKLFEVRFNDRDYRAGDTLILREWIPPERWIEQYQGDGYTGEKETVTVTYVLDDPRWCKPGYVVLGLGVERKSHDMAREQLNQALEALEWIRDHGTDHWSITRARNTLQSIRGDAQ